MRLLLLIIVAVSVTYCEADGIQSDNKHADTKWILNELHSLRQNQHECNAKLEQFDKKQVAMFSKLAQFDEMKSRLDKLEKFVSKNPNLESVLDEDDVSNADPENTKDSSWSVLSVSTQEDSIKGPTEEVTFGDGANVQMQDAVLLRKRQAVSTVAFYALVSAVDLKDLGAHHVIVFDNAKTNVGNSYHPHTGIFTAPVSGVYCFHVTAMVYPGKHTYLQLMRDGSWIGNILPDAISKTSWDMASSSFVIEVNKGSEVWVQNVYVGAELYGESAYTSFSGFLLLETE